MEAKYQFLIKKREDVETKHFMIQKLLLNTQIIWIFIKAIEDHNPNKKRKILFVFDMIADMLSNKKT